MLTEHAMIWRDPNHLYRINGTEMQFEYGNDDTIVFSHVSDRTKMVDFSAGVLNRKRSTGEIEVVPYSRLPPELRPSHTCHEGDLSGISQIQRNRALTRHAMVCGAIDLHNEKKLTWTYASIKANMGTICIRAADYLVAELPNPETAQKLRLWREGKGPKPKTKGTVSIPDEVGPESLHRWVMAFKRGGFFALVDNSHKQGNHAGNYSANEIGLMFKVIKEKYLVWGKKTLPALLQDLKAEFVKVNAERKENDLPPLRQPGRDTLKRAVKGLNRFQVLVAQRGLGEALAKMRMSKGGLPSLRPLENVDMDEWEVDLLTILKKSGLLDFFDLKALEELGLKGDTHRWWLVAAVCRRTRVIVGMVLTANPRSSAALKCLEMITVDKSHLASSVSAMTPWPFFGIPEKLFVDNGSAFKSVVFTMACAALGTAKVQTIAGSASMRGHIESLFATTSIGLMQRLSGRTFSNPKERGDYPSEKLAVHNLDDLAYALVRWVVDIYHNQPHEGLGGRTPLQQWEADIVECNYPAHGAPSSQKRFLAFGIEAHRKVQKDGITVLNIQYASEDLAKWFLQHGNKSVELRWHPDDISKIVAFIDGEWKKIPAVLDLPEGTPASSWLRTRESLRHQDPDRKEWDEATILRAVEAIEELRKKRLLAHGMLDQGWTAARLNNAEQGATINYRAPVRRNRITANPDGMGETITPVAPVRPTAATASMEQAPAVAAEANQAKKRAITITKRAE